MAPTWSTERRERATAEWAAAQASSSATSESLQSININMSAVEPAPIEETGAKTSSSGSFRSSTYPSQPIRTQSSGQLVGGGSEAEAEQDVEADGACTSSSGSSHPSTSSAQEGGGSSTSGVSPSRKRSWTTASIESEQMAEPNQQPDLSIAGSTTNDMDHTADTVAQPTSALRSRSRDTVCTNIGDTTGTRSGAPGCTSRSDHKIPPVQTGGSACISHAAHQHRHDGSRTTSCQCYSRCDSFNRVNEHLNKHVQSTSPSGYAVHASQLQTCGDCSRSGEQCATDKR